MGKKEGYKPHLMLQRNINMKFLNETREEKNSRSRIGAAVGALVTVAVVAKLV
jgi:hypothetical protein